MAGNPLSFNVVNRHNLPTLSLTIKHILSRSHHVALDAEFTGLGDPRLTRQRNIEDRYRALADVARTHALVAFGLSVFEQPDPLTHPEKFVVNTFQFTMLCRKEHHVNPSSLSFLGEHKFDFNDQIRNGIPYSPGNDVDGELSTDSNALMRSILNQIIVSKIPTIVHNGLLDMMFVYQSFYAELPKDLTVFIADLNGVFRGGIYDTKYVSEFVTREPRTFLSYLFRKYERKQIRYQDSGSVKSVSIKSKEKIHHKYTLSSLTLAQLGLVGGHPPDQKNGKGNGHRSKKNRPLVSDRPYCEQYAAHGFCNAYSACPKSHDLEVILDWEEADSQAAKDADNIATKPEKKDQQAKKKRRMGEDNGKAVDATGKATDDATLHSMEKNNNAESLFLGSETDVDVKAALSPNPIFETYHSACFDAYMTGFIFSHQYLEYPTLMQEHGNRMYLIGKEMPIRVEKSIYTKTSQQHQDKWKRLNIE
ncbi:hypothetical protein BASA83_001045 [Batrachochytrium salamandrivorans]|nr:hypothetical protein BASA83_001045 [Batrachochytrium salamandrivorans]